MKKNKSVANKQNAPTTVGSGDLLGVCLEFTLVKDSIAFFNEFFCSVRIVYPSLPMGMGRATILKDGSVWTIDDPGDLRVDSVNPDTILREKICKILLL